MFAHPFHHFRSVYECVCIKAREPRWWCRLFMHCVNRVVNAFHWLSRNKVLYTIPNPLPYAITLQAIYANFAANKIFPLQFVNLFIYRMQWFTVVVFAISASSLWVQLNGMCMRTEWQQCVDDDTDDENVEILWKLIICSHIQTLNCCINWWHGRIWTPKLKFINP